MINKPFTRALLAAGLMPLLASPLLRAADPIPPGAAELNYTKCVINERPTAEDLAPGNKGNYKWFRGACWTAKPAAPEYFATTDGVLTLINKGDGVSPSIVGTPRDFSKGALPTLSGAKGFYIEFDVWLSGNDRDHWPAVWVMPVEHSGGNGNPINDRYPGDPPGFERWMELDVDEGGFGPGFAGTVISWTGIFPNYQRELNTWNHVSKIPLDRSQKHTFGASYDPVKRIVTWWLDGQKQFSAGPDNCVPEIAAKQNFYPIISAQSHKIKQPYKMFVSGVRAYVPAE